MLTIIVVVRDCGLSEVSDGIALIAIYHLKPVEHFSLSGLFRIVTFEDLSNVAQARISLVV